MGFMELVFLSSEFRAWVSRYLPITGLCYTRCSERCEDSAKPGAYNFFDYWYMKVAPKIRGTILGVPLGGPNNKDYNILGSILGFPM